MTMLKSIYQSLNKISWNWTPKFRKTKLNPRNLKFPLLEDF